MKSIKLEILEFSYWEHFRRAKEHALILPLEDERRKKVECELNRIQIEINKLTSLTTENIAKLVLRNKKGKK